MEPIEESGRKERENKRTVPRGVYEVLRTGQSPINGLEVKISDICYSDGRKEGHTITYVKKK